MNDGSWFLPPGWRRHFQEIRAGDRHYKVGDRWNIDIVHFTSPGGATVTVEYNTGGIREPDLDRGYRLVSPVAVSVNGVQVGRWRSPEDIDDSNLRQIMEDMNQTFREWQDKELESQRLKRDRERLEAERKRADALRRL